MICPICGTGTNSAGKPLLSYHAVALHVAGKIIGGEKTHRIWVRQSAPNIDLVGWSQQELNWKNMNVLAKIIYPTVELALDNTYVTERKIEEQTAAARRLPTVTASYVADMARVLNHILDGVDLEGRQDGEGIIGRINRLKKSGLVPRHVAAQMCAIREYRNLGEHEWKEFSDADVQAVLGAWNVIQEWASAQGIKHDTPGGL